MDSPTGRKMTKPEDLLRPHCDKVNGLDLSRLDPSMANVDGTTSTVMEMDFADLEARMLGLMLDDVAIPYPIKIQTLDILPETCKDGSPFILDGTVMKKNSFMGIWGDWIMHPKTLERLREQLNEL